MTGVFIDIQRKSYPAKGNATEHIAIADLRMRLQPHEFVCLVGPSGCGKTTLLNILAGLDRDFEGSIHLDHSDKIPVMGYVFQEPRLLPWRTVRENIELALPLPAPGLVNHLLEVMGLTSFQHVYPPRLSLGMSRRVAILRAFALEPDLLLMDEPFVSLDAETAQRVRRKLLQLWQERPHTVLFVTHDLREAIALADRLLFLSPPPMQVTREIRVTIPRAQREQDEIIEAFRRSVLAE